MSRRANLPAHPLEFLFGGFNWMGVGGGGGVGHEIIGVSTPTLPNFGPHPTSKQRMWFYGDTGQKTRPDQPELNEKEIRYLNKGCWRCKQPDSNVNNIMRWVAAAAAASLALNFKTLISYTFFPAQPSSYRPHKAGHPKLGHWLRTLTTTTNNINCALSRSVVDLYFLRLPFAIMVQATFIHY